MKIIVINGPNLNMLGKREKSIYGNNTLKDLEDYISNKFKKVNDEIIIEFFQSNHEGCIIDKIHESMDRYDGIVLNPGAFTHYSYAIHDAIKSIDINVVEVHISNIHKREEFRQKSVTASACIGQISGFGFDSYVLGITALINANNAFK
ncbi:type II 3-dehydroquinate dehydratase [Romboutsia lituseburensis]|uniref:3-dehydroquinate dehydratase n=1 Tax=Romboutsia lituseburensis DSM 797 TaxID=1121325 RepID=A0A1G9Q5S1_9FIRM|nr:type II 3-dehydroquinate dehydratase [Romboutsia lituseburensis]CEH35358.1 3-dehydroquinate dehydratase [Romboutsia lituseburensis]SDM06392.1 3-dehydroquinate dehydratase [Romboutsia lituseburensis DSM 797]